MKKFIGFWLVACVWVLFGVGAVYAQLEDATASLGTGLAYGVKSAGKAKVQKPGEVIQSPTGGGFTWDKDPTGYVFKGQQSGQRDLVGTQTSDMNISQVSKTATKPDKATATGASACASYFDDNQGLTYLYQTIRCVVDTTDDSGTDGWTAHSTGKGQGDIETIWNAYTPYGGAGKLEILLGFEIDEEQGSRAAETHVEEQFASSDHFLRAYIEIEIENDPNTYTADVYWDNVDGWVASWTKPVINQQETGNETSSSSADSNGAFDLDDANGTEDPLLCRWTWEAYVNDGDEVKVRMWLGNSTLDNEFSLYTAGTDYYKKNWLKIKPFVVLDPQ